MKLSKRTISNFATYFMGIAIGLVLVGAIMAMKQRVFQQHRTVQDQQAQQQTPQQTQQQTQQSPTSGEIQANPSEDD